MAIRDVSGNFLGPNNLGANRYEFDGYSGSQILLYIGDVVIDSAIAIQFDAQQTKTPLFGYANQYYTCMADGKFIVQGSLTVAFKESGYLLWPIQRIVNKMAEARLASSLTAEGVNTSNYSTSPRYSVDSTGNLVRGYNPNEGSLLEASRAARNKGVMRANVEQMFDWDSSDGASRENYNYNRLWNELEALPDNKFEDWAEAFEDAIWYGSESSNPLLRDQLFSKNLKIDNDHASITDEDVLSHRRVDQYPELDIIITYGDMNRPATNHTVRKLLDVSFLGTSQIIEPSGQPIYEQYSFLARNFA